MVRPRAHCEDEAEARLLRVARVGVIGIIGVGVGAPVAQFAVAPQDLAHRRPAIWEGAGGLRLVVRSRRSQLASTRPPTPCVPRQSASHEQSRITRLGRRAETRTDRATGEADHENRGHEAREAVLLFGGEAGGNVAARCWTPHDSSVRRNANVAQREAPLSRSATLTHIASSIRSTSRTGKKRQIFPSLRVTSISRVIIAAILHLRL